MIGSGKEGKVKRVVVHLLVGLAIWLELWSPAGHAGEPEETPVVEQILDILLQRGQITQEEYRTLQEKARQEQAAGAKELGAAVSAGVVARGWYASATYILTDEDRVFNGSVVPRHPFTPIFGRIRPELGRSAGAMPD
jgi:hypothetical protein